MSQSEDHRRYVIENARLRDMLAQLVLMFEFQELRSGIMECKICGGKSELDHHNKHCLFLEIKKELE